MKRSNLSEIGSRNVAGGSRAGVTPSTGALSVTTAMSLVFDCAPEPNAGFV